MSEKQEHEDDELDEVRSDDAQGVSGGIDFEMKIESGVGAEDMEDGIEEGQSFSDDAEEREEQDDDAEEHEEEDDEAEEYEEEDDVAEYSEGDEGDVEEGDGNESEGPDVEESSEDEFDTPTQSTEDETDSASSSEILEVDAEGLTFEGALNPEHESVESDDEVNDELAFDDGVAVSEVGNNEVGDNLARVNESRSPEAVADAKTQVKSVLEFQPVALPPMSHAPNGVRRPNAKQQELVDAMSGRASVFGFGYQPIIEALHASLDSYLGDGAAFADGTPDDTHAPLVDQFDLILGNTTAVSADSIAILPSPDLALEHAIQLARRFRSGKSFRTIAMVGSDHGRTGMCRTASGRPELHEGLGPMMAGFGHVPFGDLDAVRAIVDDQTACVLLSPIDLGRGAVACEGDYMSGLRELCSERGVLLAIDETQIVFGSAGQPFAFSALAEIHADIVIAAAGLFAGLPGGLVLSSHHVTGSSAHDFHRYPLLTSALEITLGEMVRQGLPQAGAESAHEFAVAMAEQLSGFEFVRDVHVLGMTLGIETDIDSRDLVSAAAARGLCVESAGETAIRLHPPLVMSDADRQLMLDRLVESMEVIERETAELSL